jgi:hypothetical protein
VSSASKIKGHCHWQSAASGRCQRRAKVELACRLCNRVTLKACNFHRDRLYGELQEHVRIEHPEEYRDAMAIARGERPGAGDGAQAGEIDALGVDAAIHLAPGMQVEGATLRDDPGRK